MLPHEPEKKVLMEGKLLNDILLCSSLVEVTACGLYSSELCELDKKCRWVQHGTICLRAFLISINVRINDQNLLQKDHGPLAQLRGTPPEYLAVKVYDKYQCYLF